MTVEYEQIKEKFLSGTSDGCEVFFEKNGFYTEAGYCYIILDELEKARDMFTRASISDIRGHWGLVLLQMLAGKVTLNPTYFEIRNFLELDLSIFIKYYKAEYINEILKFSDFMAYYNPETFKYLGRAFWANNFIPAAMFFLRKAKDKFYNDPELHYLIAYIAYHNDKDFKQAEKSLKTCLEILPEYAPAIALQKAIRNLAIRKKFITKRL